METSVSANSVTDPANAVIDSTSPRPAASSAALVRPVGLFISVPLPLPVLVSAPVPAQSVLSRDRGGSRFTTRAGCTQHHPRDLALRRGKRGLRRLGRRAPDS